MTLRTLVVDDSIIYRKSIRDALAGIRGVNVIDVAKDGEMAIEKIVRMRPDLVTLDIEMPGMNGLEVLQAIRQRGLSTNAIMVSGMNQRGAEVTTQALTLGALDFIVKPDGPDLAENLQTLRQALAQRIAMIQHRDLKQPTTTPVPVVASSTPSMSSFAVPPRSRTSDAVGVDLILVGISTGGPKALSQWLPEMPADFPIPIVIVQHMPPIFTASMASHLNSSCRLSVSEAADGSSVAAGSVLVAPGGRQTAFHERHGQWTTRVNDDPALNSCRPSVDYLLRSVPASVAARTLTLIMTGMGDDGTDGCRGMKQHGGRVWAQSQSTCTVFGMPRQIIEHGLADQVFELEELSSRLVRVAQQSRVMV